MSDNSLSSALKEAYASAPVDVIIYSTLELWHPAFSIPIRVVNGASNIQAKLESDAPRNAGQEVNFVAFSFSLKKPDVSADGTPSLTIEIDNVSRQILREIRPSVSSTGHITAIYREYLSNDLEAPQNDPPIVLTITNISATIHRVTATATLGDYNNRKFPNFVYDTRSFPGLLP